MRDVVSAYLAQIHRLNPQVNAICTLRSEDEIFADVAELERRISAKQSLGPLAGLPIAIKDLALTKGLRTTMRSPLFAEQIPKTDALFVQRIKQAGAIVVGKTNTPEFGAGSQTFNPLFGATRNPWNLSRTVGGSSGGAAAALASGMLPIADGSDMGGSLRNPAAFCSVVGFRPSVGRVPSYPSLLAWQSRLGVEGPMARNVADCRLLFDVMAGPDIRDPLSLCAFEVEDNASFQTQGLQVGWTADAGFLPVDPQIRSTFQAARTAFESVGCHVHDDVLDLRDAMGVFRVLRANSFAESTRSFYPDKKSQLKSTMIRNIEEGRALSGMDLSAADRTRTQIYQRACAYFEHNDFLVMPSTQVPPFDINTEWVEEIDGVKMQDYIDWMTICCIVTVTGLPAISIPCGFTDDGLPVGLQIIGKPGADLSVFQFAACVEQQLGLSSRRPSLIEGQPA